ncbi:electron transporter SenC [Hymenobacter sedentarius]|uniref:Electron transporter SenC n=1 Tax=Hymenobacter sedentarius TaxID=1411621 RepID=A0A0U4ACC1_9BACT|nr:SCO family protein [Hymenobacter sedentarius]ALW85852.1 electron transporter SenC [Hymenobacter sedentarius]
MLKRFFLLPALAASLFTACTGAETNTVAQLPILGEREVKPRADGGPADTIFATVPAFRLTDQAGQVITNQTFAGRAYIADFFFATCPGICPKMQSELLKVYSKYAKDPRVVFLSHTIDPAHDTLPALRDYAQRLGITDASRWHFATTGAHGEPTAKDTVFQLARAYFTAAQPDKEAPGGFAHNGTFALVDDQGHIRGLYDSLNPKEVDRLLAELPTLLAEIDARKAKPVAGIQ